MSFTEYCKQIDYVCARNHCELSLYKPKEGVILKDDCNILYPFFAFLPGAMLLHVITCTLVAHKIYLNIS